MWSNFKIDGVAISITYEDGLLAVGATRGDGERGDDVTHNLRAMPEVPLRLNAQKPPKLFEVRGEVYLARADLVRINQDRAAKGLEPYANCRNLTAGSLKLLDSRKAANASCGFSPTPSALRWHRAEIAPGNAGSLEGIWLPGEPAHAKCGGH